LSRKINTQEGIIRPMRRKSAPELGPDVLMVMGTYDLDYFVSLKQGKDSALTKMGFFNLYQIKDGPNLSFTLAGSFLGAPQAVMGMEMIIPLGAKRIWVFGWCGSLDPTLRIGDLVIPTRGISEEGTSQHYPIGERPPETETSLNEILAEALEKVGQSYRKGMVWTTDAPFRETPSKIKDFQARGVLAVDMEMSALMTLAIFRDVKLTGLLVVSDELFDLKWNPGFAKPEFQKSLGFAREFLFKFVESHATTHRNGRRS
jgi:nucleoside phosphorylase